MEILLNIHYKQFWFELWKRSCPLIPTPELEAPRSASNSVDFLKHYVHISDPRLSAYNCLFQACLLAIILFKHGHELTASNLGKMELLVCDLRTAFLDPNTNGAIRSVLLLPIELSSCAWTLPESPKQYYGRNGFAKLLYKDPPKMLMNVEKFDE